MKTEMSILDWIQTIRTPFGDRLFTAVTKLGNGGFIWILLTAILLIIPKKRRSGMILAVALFADFILCNEILKHLVTRVRPCNINTSVQLLIAHPQDFSFPSGHTAAAFATVAALYLAGERKLWKLMLLPAVMIALSRLYLYVHYPTDILGGIITGTLAGCAGYWLYRKMKGWKMKNFD